MKLKKDDLIDISNMVEKGNAKLSTYEIYIKYHLEYTVTEKQWIHDFISVRLETDIWYEVSFDSNGGSEVESQIIIGCRKASMPEEPVKEGSKTDCTELHTVKLPSTLITIEDSAIYGCKKLVNINFGETIETIGTSAFELCTSLTTVYIPENVKTI